MAGPSLTERVRATFGRLREFLTHGLWERDFSQQRGVQWFLVRQLQVLVLVAKGMREDAVQLRAAFLSMITLLSIIPFLAVIFSVFTAAGGLGDLRHALQAFIYENIAVGSESELVHWIDRLVTQVNSGTLGGIGSVILVFASVRLVASIEVTFNSIWGVRRSRSLLARFVVYWTLLTLGPLVLAASLAGSAALRGWIGDGVLPGLAVVFRVVPLILTVGAFTLLYMVIPGTDVKLRHALVGGTVAALLFEVAKLTYAFVAGNLLHYNLIYGSLGAIPIFMLWVYITWLIVLFGCEITFANQNVSTLRHEERALEASEYFRERLAARLMLDVALAFHRGDPPPTAAALSQGTQVSVRLVNEVLRHLGAADLIREASHEGSKDPGFLPARLLSQVTVADVVQALRARRGVDLELADDGRGREIARILGEGEVAAGVVYGRVDYLTLAEHLLPGGRRSGVAEERLPS